LRISNPAVGASADLGTSMRYRTYRRTICLTWGNDHEIEVEVEATPYQPARTWGLPENCCPAEGGDIEVISIFLLHTVSKVAESNRYFVKTNFKYRKRKLPDEIVDKLAEDESFVLALESALTEGGE